MAHTWPDRKARVIAKVVSLLAASQADADAVITYGEVVDYYRPPDVEVPGSMLPSCQVLPGPMDINLAGLHADANAAEGLRVPSEDRIYILFFAEPTDEVVPAGAYTTLYQCRAELLRVLASYPTLEGEVDHLISLACVFAAPVGLSRTYGLEAELAVHYTENLLTGT